MSRRRKKQGPDFADVIFGLEVCAPDDEGFVRIPKSLFDKALTLLKAAERPGRGCPKEFPDRLRDAVVTAYAKDRFEELRAQDETREDALDAACEYAAALDHRPRSKALTASTIRERLTHPGDYKFSIFLDSECVVYRRRRD